MFDVSSKESTLRVSTSEGEPVTLAFGSNSSQTVRLEIEATCGCSEVSAPRVGSYTDTDFGIR
ncbi:hypothetical protein ACPFL9_04275 [Paenarthrobacter sp. NyZ202]|uniref:hypothetical protein n=1 Tax=Paenarthrobacter sp. NyZ202 TaxID=3402689 RepID=UPI003CECC960